MIRKTLSSKKGASSILVILLLIVLVVFGIAALTTALSNYRLGQKVVDWNGSYYAVEAEAQQRFAAVDKALAKAYETGGNIKAALYDEIGSLGFETDISVDKDEIEISYTAWNKENGLGLDVTLVHDVSDPNSLNIRRWKEIQ